MNPFFILRSFRRPGLFLVLGAFLASAAIAAADQTYPIKLNLNKGDQWAFDTTTSMKEKGQVLANGQVAQPIDQAMEQRRKGTIEILAVENGLPTAMKISYDADSSNGGNAGPQQVPPFSLAGKTVHLSKKDGIVSSDLGNDIDTPTVQEVSHMLDPDTSIYPKAPVALNEEWDGDTSALAKAFQLNPEDKIAIKCKLTAVHDVEGRQIADVGITGSLLKHDQGFVETRIALEGISHIDLQSGQPIDSSMTGKITSRGAQQTPGPDGTPVNISVSADGTISVRQLVKILNAAAPAAGGFNVPPASAPPQPENSPARGDNAATFSGSFKGDQIALELNEAGGKYTGNLTVGEKKYPVNATADGNKLTGNFESDGTKFDFTASLQGGTLTLTSEGNTYTLRKPASNPLARPAPKNPLAQ